jgi:hypothetical protein
MGRNSARGLIRPYARWVAKERPQPADPGEDEDQGSWFLRSGGAWVFALALWLAGVGGSVVFARDGAEVATARWFGTPGTVTIDTCAHTKNYALCYGPFEARNGSIRIKRLELRTLHHDQPGRQEKTWLRSRSATHAWASDVNPWTQLIPVLPFALLGIVQTGWLALSWRAWRRERRLRKRQQALGPPAPVLGAPAAPPTSPPAPPSPVLTADAAPTAAYPLLPPGPPPPAPTAGGHLPPGAPHVPASATVYPPEPAGAYPPGPTAGYQPATGRAQPPGGPERPAPGVYRSRPPRVEYTQPPARRPPATGAVGRPGYRPGDEIDDRHDDRRGEQFGDQSRDHSGDQSGARPGAEDGRWAGWQDRQGSAAPGRYPPQAPPDQFAPPAPPLRARRPHRERPEHG